MIIGKVINDNFDGVQHEHETWHSVFEIPPHTLLETSNLDVGLGFGDTKLIDKRKDGSWRNAAATEANEGVETGIIPIAHMSVLNELHDTSFREYGTSDVQTTISGGRRQ